MLGGLHVADFGGQRRTCPAREQQCGNHWAQLAQQGQGDHLPHRLLGAVLGQDAVTLQCQHHADEHTGHRDDRQRQHAHRIQLFGQQLKTAADAATADQCMEQEQAGTPEHGQHVDRRATKQADTFKQGFSAHQRAPNRSAR
ncbi:hypothetical protein D3C78_1010640 [compost metagenome]